MDNMQNLNLFLQKWLDRIVLITLILLCAAVFYVRASEQPNVSSDPTSTTEPVPKPFAEGSETNANYTRAKEFLSEQQDFEASEYSDVRFDQSFFKQSSTTEAEAEAALDDMISQARSAYARGEYEQALKLLDEVRGRSRTVNAEVRELYERAREKLQAARVGGQSGDN